MNRIDFGDCRATMRAWAADGIKAQMCVTSPPYYGLRDYGHEGQIGLEETPEEFIANLVETFRCVRDVLADDGTLFVNIGDSYYRNPKKGGSGPGGKNEAKWGYGSANAQRAAACGTSGKEPANFQASGCLCGSLCGACRTAYRIGKSRNGGPLAPTPALSPCASNRVRTESVTGHLPTSDSMPLVGRTSGAIEDQRPVLQSQPGAQPDALGSTTGESSQQLRAECLQEPHQVGECQLCGCSFSGCVQESSHMVECSFCTESHESEYRIAGKGVSGLAYPNSTNASLKEKDLIGIPWMLAFALRADGWYLRQDIIWHKPNPMPESVRDRCTKAHEYVFLLSKSERYHYDHEAVREPEVCGRMRGPALHRDTVSTNGNSGLARRESDGFRNRRSVWTVATRPYKGAHFATFPPALIEPCILAGSRPGDIVLDPFMGSGTTAATALQHGRQYLGCELNPEYGPLQEQRIAEARAAIYNPQLNLLEA